VRDNNLGQSIRCEGLPDLVKSIAYGSMHVRHFSKPDWETRIVSLPRHSAYGCDEVALQWLRDDLINREDVRLFVFDFSEADFLGHAYGSTSEQYEAALERIDRRIYDLIRWMEHKGILEDTGIVVCSDHGIAAIDHGYLLARSEVHVPFFLYGKGIRAGHVLGGPGTIMDVAITVAYLLGVAYPSESRGQVFTEALERADFEREREELVSRFNRIGYGLKAQRYAEEHTEIIEGDREWLQASITGFVPSLNGPISILDIGCGTGFVGDCFLLSRVSFERFVCHDVSEEMLGQARLRLGNDHRFSFETTLPAGAGRFNVVTVNSVLHHLAYPEKLASIIGDLLVPGGLVLGAHEPNKRPFRNPIYLALATLYKKAGGGVPFDQDIERKFNEVARSQFPGAARVCLEEILQLMEFHSPVEQYVDGIDPETGFIPEEFLSRAFPGHEILLLDTYTTFFHRPALNRHRALRSTLQLIYRTMFREGNLFRYVIRKDNE